MIFLAGLTILKKVRCLGRLSGWWDNKSDFSGWFDNSEKGEVSGQIEWMGG